LALDPAGDDPGKTSRSGPVAAGDQQLSMNSGKGAAGYLPDFRWQRTAVALDGGRAR